MLKIGLTGGIGSGKTAASDHFATLGAEVIDTDLLSRELVAPGQPALQAIAEAFGKDILHSDGTLNRGSLRDRVFADSSARQTLENILHPRIRTEMLARAQRSNAPYVVFVIPLLLETGQQHLVDRILLIDVPEAIQRQRVAARDRLSDAQITQILTAQSDRATRLRHADDIVVNDGDLAQLQENIQQLHRKYLQQVQS